MGKSTHFVSIVQLFCNFAAVKPLRFIGVLALVLALAGCQSPKRQARRMVAQAERMFDTLPDSTTGLIDSVLMMPVLFSERERMDMTLLQGEALFGGRGQEVPPVMDDEFFDDRPFLSPSPDLEQAAYYVRKKRYDRAARAALYSGLVRQHYGWWSSSSGTGSCVRTKRR